MRLEDSTDQIGDWLRLFLCYLDKKSADKMRSSEVEKEVQKDKGCKHNHKCAAYLLVYRTCLNHETASSKMHAYFLIRWQ